MEKQNILDWKTYESLTKYIYETLGKKFGVNIEGYGNNCKVKGKSGIYHQIDVLTSESGESGIYRTAIECKYWNKKINKDIVMKLCAILSDSGIDEGIIVSKNGFTKDAMQFANHHNIKLTQLREAGEEDHDTHKELEIAVIDFQINITVHRPQIFKIIVSTNDDQSIILSEKDQYQISIENCKKRKIRLFDAIMIFKEDLHNEKPFTIIVKNYDFKDSILYLKDHEEKIKEIKFIGMLKYIHENHNKTFSVRDQVWLIMKSIFEQQVFIISKYGYIMEQQ